MIKGSWWIKQQSRKSQSFTIAELFVWIVLSNVTFANWANVSRTMSWKIALSLCLPKTHRRLVLFGNKTSCRNTTKVSLLTSYSLIPSGSQLNSCSGLSPLSDNETSHKALGQWPLIAKSQREWMEFNLSSMRRKSAAAASQWKILKTFSLPEFRRRHCALLPSSRYLTYSSFPFRASSKSSQLIAPRAGRVCRRNSPSYQRRAELNPWILNQPRERTNESESVKCQMSLWLPHSSFILKKTS